MLSRRKFLASATATGLVLKGPAVFAQKKKSLVFSTYGGSYGRAVNEYLVKPFEERTGIAVQQGQNQALAPLKIQVLSKNVQWDLVELAGGDFSTGLREGLFEPIDTKIVKLNKAPTLAVNEYGVEYALFLSGIGYDKRTYTDSDAPKNWKDFWDTTKFKGLRGLSKHISDTPTLEAALMASGVSMDALYPLDVKRAFESLKTLGMKNIFWFETNQQPVDMLNERVTSISQIASGRVSIANREGAKIGFVYDQVQLNGDYLVVPKGAKNKEAAFELMNFILNDDDAAINWMKATTYTISNQSAVAKMPIEIAKFLPTSPEMKGKYFQKNFGWWGENGPKTTLLFQRLIAS